MMTVSRVLRGAPDVADATRERVFAIVDRVGYVPNQAAQSLVSRRSRIVAAVVPSIGNAMFAETLHGMSDVLRAEGYFLVVAHCGYSPREEHAVVKALLGQRPCGMFLHNTVHRPETIDLLRKQRIPVIETGDLTARPIDSVVSYSNFRAGRAMTEHLVGRGYRRIAFASALRRNNDRALERRRGYHAALKAAGLRRDPSREFEGDPDPVVGARLLHAILERCPDVDAIFFASERLAIGGYFEARRLGLAVPGRVAIAGFDFYEANSQVLPAAITTIVTPRHEIGVATARLIVERLRDGSDAAVTRDLGFELAERGST